jgi:hypothetical protein
LRGRTNVIWSLLLGSLIVLVLMHVPFLGILVTLAMFWMGVGMTLLLVAEKYQRPNYSLS